MYLRKATTSPFRGTDILDPLYVELNQTHAESDSLDILHVGAGVGVKMLRKRTNSSKVFRKLDSLLRSLPLPSQCFASYEPIELYEALLQQGFFVRYRVADINPNVLSIVQRQRGDRQIAFELVDISNIAKMFLTDSFDACIALNVFPHIKGQHLKRKAARNLVRLTKVGGYIVGVPLKDILMPGDKDICCLEEVDNLVYRKYSN